MSKVDPARLLQWLKRNEPEVFAETHAVMAAKDYLRFRMTGELAVSLSDFGRACSSIQRRSNMMSGRSARFGIPEAARMLPPIRDAWGGLRRGDAGGCAADGSLHRYAVRDGRS